MNQAEYAKLHAAMEMLIYLTQELEKKRVSVQRLKQMLFGATTETTRKVMEKVLDEIEKKNTDEDTSQGEDKQKPKGHGRNGAKAYVGAEKVCISHESLHDHMHSISS